MVDKLPPAPVAVVDVITPGAATRVARLPSWDFVGLEGDFVLFSVLLVHCVGRLTINTGFVKALLCDYITWMNYS